MLRGLFFFCVFLVATGASAESLRVATFSTELSRKGPGLLLRDILKGEDEQVAAVVGVISEVNADILLLGDIDYDHGQAAITALADLLADFGAAYPYRFSLRPNTGIATGLDMDNNGRTGEPRDAQGYGAYAGQGGMALLSRFPVVISDVGDLSAVLWKDVPGATLPVVNGEPFLSEEVRAVQRLSSTGHWIVPIQLDRDLRLTVLAFAATPPVFDGPEDRNGLRNADEIGLWQACFDGLLPNCPPTAPFVVLGKANLDPVDGDGRHERIQALLADPRLQDTMPQGAGGASNGSRGHIGNPSLDTADWSEPAVGGPGNLRVDYVLPSSDLTVRGGAVHWPSGGAALDQAIVASRHRLVWVDLEVDR